MARYDQISEDYVAFVDAALDNSDSLLSLATNSLLNVAGSVTGLHVVDVACGEGYLARKLALYAGQVIGVDNSDKLLQTARERSNTPNVSFVQDDAHGLTRLPRQSADLILCHLSLMDFQDLDKVYQAIQRTLKPGGRFVSSITHPCFFSPDAQTQVDGNGQFMGQLISHYAKEESWRFEVENDIRFQNVTTYHRPLSRYINVLLANNFTLTQMLEPVLPSHAVTYGREQMHIDIPSIMIFAAIRN